jgi:hypothetical protein
MNTKIRMKTFKNENNKIITQKYSVKSKPISKEQIEMYWNLFAVVPSYRIKFDNLCKTLPEIQREQIYETEYNRLDNLKNITNKLNAAVKEKFNLVNQIKSIDDYKITQQSEDIITKLFHNLRETLIKLIELMNKFIHLYSYEFQNEKYNIDMLPVDFRKEIFYCVKNPNKLYMSFIFDGLDFIKNTFSIKNNFDFLLFNSIYSNNYDRSKRYTKCKKIVIDNGAPLKLELKNKNILILQNESEKTKENNNSNTNLIIHKKCNSFTKSIIKSRNIHNNESHKINDNTNLQTQQLKQQILQQPTIIAIPNQKQTLNQNKSNIPPILHDNVLPKLNLKLPIIGKKGNKLNMNLFSKKSIPSRNRNSFNYIHSNNIGTNSLKFFSIDDKQFKHSMKGFNSNIPITERKHPIINTNIKREIYKL